MKCMGSKISAARRCKWRVGNGTYINVWTDFWLSGKDPVRTPLCGPLGNLNLRDADLINFNKGQCDLNYEKPFVRWNKLSFFSFLYLSLFLKILCIGDQLNNGEYLMKFGYWLSHRGYLGSHDQLPR